MHIDMLLTFEPTIETIAAINNLFLLYLCWR